MHKLRLTAIFAQNVRSSVALTCFCLQVSTGTDAVCLIGELLYWSSLNKTRQIADFLACADKRIINISSKNKCFCDSLGADVTF